MKRRIATILLLGLALAGCRRAPASEDHPGAGPAAGSPAVPVSAPALEGTGTGGGHFSLSSLHGFPVVLIFYRGAFCGICVQRLAAAEGHRAAYRAAGARLVAVTPEPADSLEAIRKRLDLRYPLVSVAPAVLQRWGVWRAGEPAPRPAEFVLDAGGRIRFAHIGRTAADRVSDEALLGVLRGLAPAAGGGR